MPALDRQISIVYAAPGTFDEHGEYVPGADRRFNVWAQLRSQTGTDGPTVAGQRATGTKTYRVRWFSVIADVQSQYLTVYDGTLDGQRAIVEWNVTDFREVAGNFTMRRRFFDLDVLADSG